MIRHIEDAELLKNLAFLEEDPLFPRLAVNAAAYGLSSPFFDLWMQEAGENPVAVMGRLDGQMTLVAKEGFDAGELALFLQAAGFETLLCQSTVARRLPFFRARTAVLLRREGPVSSAETGLALDWAPSPRTLYALLKTCTGASIRLPPFDGWYVDVSHKLRRGLIRAVIACEGGEPVGCAMTAGESEGQALLSAVAVVAEYRGRGYGRALVDAMSETLQKAGKQVFLLRDASENEAFYRSLGFEPLEEYAFLRPAGKGEADGQQTAF